QTPTPFATRSPPSEEAADVQAPVTGGAGRIIRSCRQLHCSSATGRTKEDRSG
ncbi:hypothetical protein ABG768_004035, partial [Culter alburnus]